MTEQTKEQKEQDYLREGIELLVEEMNVAEVEFTEWEENFILSLQEKLRFNKINLTERQTETFERLMEKIG